MGAGLRGRHRRDWWVQWPHETGGKAQGREWQGTGGIKIMGSQRIGRQQISNRNRAKQGSQNSVKKPGLRGGKMASGIKGQRSSQPAGLSHSSWSQELLTWSRSPTWLGGSRVLEAEWTLTDRWSLIRGWPQSQAEGGLNPRHPSV